MTKQKGKKLISQLKYWEKAMRAGLIGGRPFSEPTITVYAYYARWFLERYEEISVQTLNCLAKYLIEDGLLEHNYLAEAKPLKPKRHKPPKRTTVSEAYIENLIVHCDKPMDKLLIILLSSTGLRVSEAANLQLKDIDMTAKTLTIRWAKWGKTRRVGIPERLHTALTEYLASQTDQSPDTGLFLKTNGKPMDRIGIACRLGKLARKTGILVTPHTLRRAFVTINANKGRPLPMLQIACGHSDITTTPSSCLTTEDETIETMQAWD